MQVGAASEVLRQGSPGIRGAHRTHALAMLIVPVAGSVLAALDVVQHGVSALDLSLMAALYVANGLGITVGFHRLFAHRAFKAPDWLIYALAIAGSMAGQGPPIYWVANHRRHHRYSDRNGDPHSPYVDGARTLSGLRGFIHAHMGWTVEHELTSTLVYTPDLLKQRALRNVNRSYLIWLACGLFGPALIGRLATHSWYGAYSALLWGGFVRLFFSYHFTLAINSATHLFGSSDFDTGDHSRNSSWLALPTFGEAWHNNHHAFPSAALFAAKWWQVDLGGYSVLLLKSLGVVHDVKTIAHDKLDRKRRES